MQKNITIISVVSLILFCCSGPEKPAVVDFPSENNISHPSATEVPGEIMHPADSIKNGFVNILSLDSSVIIDMPYADTANFTHHQIYSCAVCELRKEVAAALVKANQLAQKENLTIKVFDCYRPSSAQQKMYDVVPDKKYVADPKKGSKHGSGCAVDVTLCNKKGELDMGTGFDDFSEKSHLDNNSLSEEVKKNRAILLRIMRQAGFSEYNNEWWHFNFKDCNHAQDDHSWECK